MKFNLYEYSQIEASHQPLLTVCTKRLMMLDDAVGSLHVFHVPLFYNHTYCVLDLSLLQVTGRNLHFETDLNPQLSCAYTYAHCVTPVSIYTE